VPRADAVRNRARLIDVQLQIDNNLADYLNVPTDILAPWGQDTSDLFGVKLRVRCDDGRWSAVAV